jgi:hypothetical protein
MLTIGHNPDTRPGDLQIMEIAQFEAKTMRQVGGLWVVVQS